jgi:hypothetical protein
MKTLLCVLLYCVWVAFAHAQEPPPVRALRLALDEKIMVDGSLSAPAWQRAPVFDQFIENTPVRGSKAKYQTHAQVLYDDHALYVGVRARDPEPPQMRDIPVRHDYVNRTQDFVAVYVDAVGKKKAAQFFRVSVAGSTADGLHTADNDNEDFSPDFDFDAASQRTADGYTAVFRIPFASLRFAPQATQPWRVMIIRRIPREQYTLDLSVDLPREAASFITNLQTLQDFTPPAQQAFVQVRPTLTARHTQEDAPEGKTPGNELKSSLDIKWRPRAELVVDATLNPDFSQVELDVPQLARNTSFALFLSEKRPVFLESADLLTSPTDALYTRTINDPRWALRGSWRGTLGANNSLSATAITAQDRGGGLTLLPGPFGTGSATQPASTTLMSRARVDAHDYAYGALLTHRDYEQGVGTNTVMGVDGNWQLTDAWRWRGQLLRSSTTALADEEEVLMKQGAQHGLRLYTGLNHQRAAHSSFVTLDVSDAVFRNDAGFVTQTGIRKVELEHRRLWEQLGPFNIVEAYVEARHTQDRASGQTASATWAPGVYLAAARNTEVVAEVHTASLVRSQANTPLLREQFLFLYGATSPSIWLSLIETEWSIGKLADVEADRLRNGFNAEISARLRPVRRLEIEPSISRLYLRSDANGGALTETAAQLLTVLHIAPKHTLRLIAQSTRYHREEDGLTGLSTQSDRSNTQSLTYTWRQSAGTVLYAGGTRSTEGISPDRVRNTEVFVKWQADAGSILGL